MCVCVRVCVCVCVCVCTDIIHDKHHLKHTYNHTYIHIADDDDDGDVMMTSSYFLSLKTITCPCFVFFSVKCFDKYFFSLMKYVHMNGNDTNKVHIYNIYHRYIYTNYIILSSACSSYSSSSLSLSSSSSSLSIQMLDFSTMGLKIQILP